MEKKPFVRPELETVRLSAEDVVATSTPGEAEQDEDVEQSLPKEELPDFVAISRAAAYNSMKEASAFFVQEGGAL